MDHISAGIGFWRMLSGNFCSFKWFLYHFKSSTPFLTSCVAPCILIFDISWMWPVSFTSWPLYPCGNIIYTQLHGFQSQFGCCGRQKNLLPLSGIEPWLLCLPASSSVTILSHRHINFALFFNLCSQESSICLEGLIIAQIILVK
jgi:hypothetical protein